jgi:uncharacterized protein YjiS (DUF1127 family)
MGRGLTATSVENGKMHTGSLEAIIGRQGHGSRAWALRALAPLAAASARHRDAARLAGLPDHLLADIGLTRDAVRRRRMPSDGG